MLTQFIYFVFVPRTIRIPLLYKLVGLLGGAADTALTLGPHEHFPHLG